MTRIFPLIVRIPALVTLLVTLLFAVRSDAAVTFTPAAPTASDTIGAVIDVPGFCTTEDTTVVTGTTIRTTITFVSCAPIPGPTILPIEFGPVPAGSYTYEVYFTLDGTTTLELTQPLVVSPAVAAAPIPTLDHTGKFIVIISFAAVALLALKRAA